MRRMGRMRHKGEWQSQIGARLAFGGALGQDHWVMRGGMRLVWVYVVWLGLSGYASPAAEARVSFIRTPDGGIQPQAMVAGRGVVHLIYFKGEAKGGDIFYVRREPGQQEFSKPIQVNTQPQTPMAIGTIGGSQ